MVEQKCDCIEEGSSVLSPLMPTKMNISVQEPTHIQSVYINSLLSFCSFSVLSLTHTQSLFIQALTHTHTQTLFIRSLSHLWRAHIFKKNSVASDISTIQNYIEHVYVFILYKIECVDIILHINRYYYYYFFNFKFN